MVELLHPTQVCKYTVINNSALFDTHLTLISSVYAPHQFAAKGIKVVFLMKTH